MPDFDANLTPPSEGHNRLAADLRLPSRDDLRRLPRRGLKRGRRTKAEVYEIDLGDGPMVVKDFGANPWWIRWFGRLQTARECAAYRALADVPGFPAWYGRIDPWALALERVVGHQLAFAPDRFTAAEVHVARLRRTVDDMHAAGVAHLDLRGRENVLVDDDGRIIIVDLAGSVRMRPGSLAHRLLFHGLALLDESAFLKWKLLLAPDRLSPREKEFLSRFRRFVRPLWPINRKDPGPDDRPS